MSRRLNSAPPVSPQTPRRIKARTASALFSFSTPLPRGSKLKSPALENSAALWKREAFAELPPVWPDDVSAFNRATASASTLVVLDDDPTGTQSVRDVAVVT